MKRILFALIVMTFSVGIASGEEWIVNNTYTNTGERVVASITGDPSYQYSGVELIGQVIDNNGNWGYALPTVTNFKLYIRFSPPFAYELVQDEYTKNIKLKLRKISDNEIRLVANCTVANRAVRVIYQQIEGSAIVTMGDPNQVIQEGTSLNALPEFESSFSGTLNVGDFEGSALKLRDTRSNPDLYAGDMVGGHIDFIAGEDWKHVMTSIRSVSSGTWYRTSSSYGASGKADIVFYTTPFQNLNDVLDEDDPSTLEERVRITHDGKVGIGTTTPDNKLDVKGTIRAEEINVETGWSDFVFDQDYPLPSLDYIESFIKERKHLPDIPSAQDIQVNGLAMAEMMAKQMQKIEELTLYLIEMKKGNQAIRDENAAIRAELKALQATLAIE